MKAAIAEDIDSYIAGFPEDIQRRLEQVRATISKAAPKAEEAIRYAMPTFVLNGNLVHFAAFKNHVSYLPFSGSVLSMLGDELDGYEMTKSSLHFAVDEPLPKALVEKLISLRLAEIA